MTVSVVRNFFQRFLRFKKENPRNLTHGRAGFRRRSQVVLFTGGMSIAPVTVEACVRTAVPVLEHVLFAGQATTSVAVLGVG